MSRWFTFLLLLSLACEGTPEHSSSRLVHDLTESASIRFEGRWSLHGDYATTVNAGSSLEARFSGTGIAARWNRGATSEIAPAGPSPIVSWQIDGGAWTDAPIDDPMPLASGLTDGTHDLRLVVRSFDASTYRRWARPLQAVVRLAALEVAGGDLVPLPPLARRRIEFVGDSLTEGVRVHYPGPGSFADHGDARRAWPWLTCEALGTACVVTGFGGQGVAVGGVGGVPPHWTAYPLLYEGEDYTPQRTDVVVISTGSNDGGSPAVVPFMESFAKLVRIVRAKHPIARIVVMRSLAGEGNVIEYSRSSVVLAQLYGDPLITWLDSAGVLTDVAAERTDGTHLSEVGNERVAEWLAPLLAPYVGGAP